MTEIGSQEAQDQFVDILERTIRGEEFLLTVEGEPAARLIPAKPQISREELEDLLEWFRNLRKEVAKKGPVLRPGETWKDLAREGLP